MWRGGLIIWNSWRCVKRWRQPKINEVWTFREDGVTRKVHPTARVDVSAFVGECFAINYLTPTWCRIPMFGRNYINGSVEWIGFPNLLRNDGPPWNLNILAPYAKLGDIDSSTSTHWGSGSEGNCDSVSISWNRPTCVLPVYHRRIFENPAVLHVAPVKIFLWRTACTAWKTLPFVATPYAFVWLTDRMKPWMISRSIICVDNFLW